MKTHLIITVFAVYSIFLINCSSGGKATQGKDSESEKKTLKWNSKNWLSDSEQQDTKNLLVKDRVRRHLFKDRQRPQQPPTVIINNRYFEEEETAGWGPPPPPPTQGWTRPTTTTTTTTTTRPPPPPTQGWTRRTTTEGWGRPTPPPVQHGWDSGHEVSGGNSWSVKGGGVLGFPHRIVQSGLDIFKRPVEPEESEEYERKTFGISIFKGKQKY